MKPQQHYVRFVRWLDEIGLDDLELVGGKNASLGELVEALGDTIKVPEGFAITADAYRRLVDAGGLWQRMMLILDQTNWKDPKATGPASAKLRKLILDAPLPDGLATDIQIAYRRLERKFGRGVAVAVRSSATAEDSPSASFAGVHESYLNVRSAKALVSAVRDCFASLFSERAISYRIDKGFAHHSVALSVGVQRMIRADRASSGVIFTLDTESGSRDVVLVSGVWGLGESIVQGIADPDEFLVHKPTLGLGRNYVLRRRIGAKAVKLVYAKRSDSGRTKWQPVPRKMKETACISDPEILDLARQAVLIEEHYTKHYGVPTPMDVEWAKDGPDGELYIIQARPETVHASTGEAALKLYRLTGNAPVLLSGQAVGQGIATGVVRFVKNKEDLAELNEGDVLVAETTAPDWESAMKRAVAIVTEHGGRTCHAAIVARELGIPAIVGATGARTLLKAGQEITISCAEGERGKVRGGHVPFAIDTVDVGNMQPVDVEIMVNIGNPDIAFRTAVLPVAGVGLARIEFIIADAISAHPMALLFPERVKTQKTRRELAALTKCYPDGADYYTSRLAEGVGVITAAFYPRPVIVRTSDFKSNEYASLLGGADFEMAENNPMLGFRGASRYVHPSFRPAFELECAAIKRVRDDMGLTNLIAMIPFCRSLKEANEVLDIMARCGLNRGENGLQVYVMCEIPSNVILVDEFAKLFDGFSIGSNDLTQLTLGIDRDADILADSFDEEDPAVLELIGQAIAGAHRAGRHCGICGQAPSDRPGFAQWLIERHIDSISLNPDSVLGVLQRLSKA
ncbi:MAG: phosphoenolpyruvate synthase [Sphingorhabdus sp.]